MGKGSREDIQMPETAEATVTQMRGGQVKELASLARLMVFASPAKRPRRFITPARGTERTLTGRCFAAMARTYLASAFAR